MVNRGKFFDIFGTLTPKNKLSVVSSLIETYECKVDVKGRLMIPVGMKKQMASVLQEGFVLRRSVFEACLELYPMSEWQEMMQKVNRLNKFKKKNKDFIRRFSAGSKVVEVDKSGRLLIPKELIAFASISKDIVITPSANIIEIWDKVKYEQVIGEATVDFADLAEEVMGQDEGHGVS